MIVSYRFSLSACLLYGLSNVIWHMMWIIVPRASISECEILKIYMSIRASDMARRRQHNAWFHSYVSFRSNACINNLPTQQNILWFGSSHFHELMGEWVIDGLHVSFFTQNKNEVNTINIKNQFNNSLRKNFWICLRYVTLHYITCEDAIQVRTY